MDSIGNARFGILHASALIFSGIGSVGAVTLYSEDFGSTNAASVAEVGWLNDIQAGDSRIYAEGDDGKVFSYASGGFAEAFYTTEFGEIDPLTNENLTLSVELNSQWRVQNCDVFFAVRVGEDWYVSSVEIEPPVLNGGWFVRTLAFDPGAGNWRHLTVSGTGALGTAPILGEAVSGTLAGSVSGAGLVVARAAGTDGTINFDNFRITGGPEDGDGDGLADDWEEMFWPGDTSKVGAAGVAGFDDPIYYDPDGDGFDNESEESGGSDPTDILSIPGDVDGDGLADLWEDANFGDNNGIAESGELALQDGAGDPDGDNGTNEQEETAMTDPNDRASFLDDDGGSPDGQNDWWEIRYFGDTTTSTAGSDDIDSDTHDNATEYAAFANPNDPSSVPGDIDGDTLNDLWEDQYFGNNDGEVTDSDLIVTNDAAGDPDADGATNQEESASMPVASNPNDPNSVPGNSDGDTLADDWELDYFADIYGQKGTNDNDNDLYTNEEEETAGTDPTDNYDFPEDTDNDDVNDRWELRWFGTLLVSEGGTDDWGDDTDNDTWFNDEEYDGLSNPNNAMSNPSDIDGDGLFDSDEIAFWGDIYTFDGDDDPDRDYSTNLEEMAAFTDPTSRASSPDTDGDLLGDGWERFSFGSILTTEGGTDDPDGDPDVDGHTNAAEYAAATNGNDPLSTPDTDGDRLPDGWEAFYFAMEGEDPVVDAATIIARQNGTDDSDGDGASNALEYLVGTDPDDIADIPTPGTVPTSFGLGADTELANDDQNAPTVLAGGNATVAIRNNRASRLRVPLVRFDISQVEGDLDRAAIRISVPWTSSVGGLINVYGLVDGDEGEAWDEATTSYSNAPGIIEDQRDQSNIWARDPQKFLLLGTISPNAVGIHYSNPDVLKLSGFLAADTDGLVTLAFDAVGNRWHGFGTKETGGADVPALILPGATVVQSSDPWIMSVSLSEDAFTMTAGGLGIGQQYHVETSTDGTFAALVGSTFTAASDSEEVEVTVDTVLAPTQLFRIAEGAEP